MWIYKKIHCKFVNHGHLPFCLTLTITRQKNKIECEFTTIHWDCKFVYQDPPPQGLARDAVQSEEKRSAVSFHPTGAGSTNSAKFDPLLLFSFFSVNFAQPVSETQLLQNLVNFFSRFFFHSIRAILNRVCKNLPWVILIFLFTQLLVPEKKNTFAIFILFFFFSHPTGAKRPILGVKWS